MDTHLIVILIAAAYLAGCLWVIPWAHRSMRATEQRYSAPQHTISLRGSITEEWARIGTAVAEGVSLPCMECGSRQVPPVGSVPSPALAYTDLIVVSLAEAGYVVTGTCAACSTPITSRPMTDAEAAQARWFGATDLDSGAVVEALIESSRPL